MTYFVYKRYVDDIFCIVDDENVSSLFLEYLNKQHRNIKFTSGLEKMEIYLFLDVNIDKKNEGGFYIYIPQLIIHRFSN